MWKNLKTQWAHRRAGSRSSPGQGLAEYALMLALVALAVIIIVNLLEVSIADVFSRLVQQAPVAPPSLANYTPAPTYTATPTIDPAASPTPTPSLTPSLTPSNTPPPTETPTLTPTATNTPTCPGYGPYALPGRVEMENFRCGGPDLAFVDSGNLDGGPGSGIYRQDVTVLGPDLDTSTDGSGYQLGWLVTNEWTQYLVNAAESRFYDFSVRVASGGTNGRFRLQIIRNGAAIHTTDPVPVPNTGGASSWSNVVVPGIPILAGANEVRFIVENGGFNVNYFDVNFGAAATPTPTPGVPCYTLAVSLNPNFGGSVSRNPLPNCGGDRYTQDTSVTLSASPNTNYAFANWSGDATGTNSNVTITMSNNRNVTANFVQCFAVTTAVNPANSGTVNLSPAPNCGSQYRAGTNVTFNANPATGYAFNNWSGSLSGSANPASLTINAPANVTANFVQLTQITENFESGGWTGGVGWNGGWTNPSNATVTTAADPYAGNYHLRLQSAGSVQRAVDLSGYSGATLSFYWKIVANNNSDRLYVEISNDGSSWHILANINTRNQPYALRSVTIPAMYLTTNARLQIRSTGNQNSDYFYIDNITIDGN